MAELANNQLFNLQAGNALAQGRALPNVRGVENLRQARKVSEEFEAVFLGQMLQPMFQNIEAAEPFEGGPLKKFGGRCKWKNTERRYPRPAVLALQTPFSVKS